MTLDTSTSTMERIDDVSDAALFDQFVERPVGTARQRLRRFAGKQLRRAGFGGWLDRRRGIENVIPARDAAIVATTGSADDVLTRSWNAFAPEAASAFLRTWGSPAVSSMDITADILRSLSREKQPRVLDLGCGNGRLYEHFLMRGLDCDYTGIDCSEPLIEAAREATRGDGLAKFLVDDAHTLGEVDETYDVVIYSHVLEILASPEQSLRRARQLAEAIVIRFFEPPVFDVDTVELKELDVGTGTPVPYLRRKMSRDFYRMMLSRLGCVRVEVSRDPGSKDEVHVLRFALGGGRWRA